MSGARRRFDWQKIHDDLELRLAGFGATYEHDPVRVAALLAERGVRLAKVPGARTSGAALTRVIVFSASGERFGLPLACAQEIRPIARLAVLPGTAPALLGIINWRGEFVTVFDAARWLGVTPAAGAQPRYVIVLRGGEPRIALAVDNLEGLVRVDPVQLQRPDQLGVTRSELFQGMSADAVMVFDGERLLGSLNEDLRAA